jgi:hypothetical protein
MAELGFTQPGIGVPSATGGSLTNDNAGALAASRVIKAAAGKAFRVSMLNTNVAARFLQLFDANALPADATVPLISIPVGIGAFVQVDFGIYGRAFANGFVVCNSTTAATKTIGAADSLFDASFV